MTLVNALHNLTQILPILYVLQKLNHSFTLQLQELPINIWVQTILSEDWCHYWPDYLEPPTLLCHMHGLTISPYPQVEGQALTDLRNTPQFIYTPNPTPLCTKTIRANLHI
jgi:hypothetical protein